MRNRVERLRRQRSDFCSRHVSMTDGEFLLALGIEGVPRALLVAMRRALADCCGIPSDYIVPHTDPDLLRPLMGSGDWLDPDEEDLDLVVFVAKVEDYCTKAGCPIALSDDMAEKFPLFGLTHPPRLFGRNPPVHSLHGWITLVTDVIRDGLGQE